jgi:hypothetical protein
VFHYHRCLHEAGVGVQFVEKPVHFSRHALQQMIERGATDDEVLEAIRSGEQVSAKRGRLGYRKNFQYERLWGGRYYPNKSLSEKLEPFRLRRDRRACRRVIRIGSKTWKSDGLVYGRAGCAPSSPRRRASHLPAATSVARRRAETPCRTRFVVPTLETVTRPGVLRAYPKNCNLFACGVIAVRAAGLFG